MGKLGQLLVARGWLTVQQLTRALQNQNAVGGRLGTCLLEMDVLGEDLLARSLAEQQGVPAAGIEELRAIPDEVLHLIPEKLARRCRAIPFRVAGGRLDVAMQDPRNLVCQDEIAFACGRRVKVHVLHELRIYEALQRYYREEVPSRYGLLLDRLNRARYLWAGGERSRAPEPADRTEVLTALSSDDFLGAPPRLAPPPLPEPSLPPIPQTPRRRSLFRSRTAAPETPPAAAPQPTTLPPLEELDLRAKPRRQRTAPAAPPAAGAGADTGETADAMRSGKAAGEPADAAKAAHPADTSNAGASAENREAPSPRDGGDRAAERTPAVPSSEKTLTPAELAATAPFAIIPAGTSVQPGAAAQATATGKAASRAGAEAAGETSAGAAADRAGDARSRAAAGDATDRTAEVSSRAGADDRAGDARSRAAAGDATDYTAAATSLAGPEAATDRASDARSRAAAGDATDYTAAATSLAGPGAAADRAGGARSWAAAGLAADGTAASRDGRAGGTADGRPAEAADGATARTAGSEAGGAATGDRSAADGGSGRSAASDTDADATLDGAGRTPPWRATRPQEGAAALTGAAASITAAPPPLIAGSAAGAGREAGADAAKSAAVEPPAGSEAAARPGAAAEGGGHRNVDLETTMVVGPRPRPRAVTGEVAKISLSAEERAALGADSQRAAAARPEPTNAAEVEAAFAASSDREEIGRILLAYLARKFRRVALFQANRQGVTAWMAQGEGVEQEAFSHYRVSFDEPSVFLNLARGSSIHMGPMPPMKAHRDLALCWGGGLPRDCLLLPVRLNERMVVAIYVDGGAAVDMPEMHQLQAAAAAAFGRCILRKKRGYPQS